MTIRCGCPDQADDLVFGPDHQCGPKTEPESTVDLIGALVGALIRAREARQQDFTLSPPESRYMETLDERPFEITLDESERGGH